MGNGNLFSVYRVGMQFFIAFGFVMDNQLVPEKVEIYPVIGAAAFFTA